MARAAARTWPGSFPTTTVRCNPASACSAGETYVGGNGYSLRLDGLEPGVNDRARARLLVMHGAWYVDPLQALEQGRLGRSYGCPALRPQIAHEVIDTLKQGQLLFAYYPDAEWMANSDFLHCDAKPSDG